jgi:hypothetical protein
VELPPYTGDDRALAADPVRRMVYLGGQGGVYAYDIGTRKLRTLPLPPAAFVRTLVVHPGTGQFYVWSSTASGAANERTLVFDAAGSQVGEMAGEVVALDPDLGLLYVRAPVEGGSGVDWSAVGRLLAMDTITGQIVAVGEVAGQVPGNPFSRPLVDRRQHRLVAVAFPARGGSRSDYSNGRPTRLSILSGRDLATIWTGPIGPLQARETQNIPLRGLNATTGRVYFASSSDATTLSQFGCLPPWERPTCSVWDRAAGGLLAIDSTRNRLYFAKSERYNEHITGMVRSSALWLAVADGESETVRRLIPVAVPRGPYALDPVAPPVENIDGRYFPETGHTVVGPFRRAWEARGGVTVLGYPLSEPFPLSEGAELYVRGATVQYFERGRLELHEGFASVQPQDSVTAQRIGLQFAAVRPAVSPSPTSAERISFDTYGHTIAEGFKAFWEANGGLAAFGYPITEEFREVNPADGKEYTVQYFERARFEYHHEFKGTSYEVQLGLLGRRTLEGRGWMR